MEFPFVTGFGAVIFTGPSISALASNLMTMATYSSKDGKLMTGVQQGAAQGPSDHACSPCDQNFHRVGTSGESWTLGKWAR